MIKFLTLILLLYTTMTNAEANYTTQKSLYDFTALDINEKSINLSDYRGKVALIVNTASNCGFTGQYAGLQKIYERYKERGFVVLGFPSNDFGSQEPGKNSEIKTFCDTKYAVTFPLFAKGSVTGANKQPVYKFLTEDSADAFQGDPGWNFVKFLVNREGQVVGRFSSLTKPESKKIINAIEKLLDENF